MSIGLYIHIPFCKSICSYCDFAKMVASSSLQKSYFDALQKELNHHKDDLAEVNTIYIGGGTPSAADQQDLVCLFQKLHELIDFQQVQEFTIEANPEDIHKDFAKLLYSHGVNRVSLGVQTIDPEALHLLNRRHQKDDVANAIQKLKDAGITNINLDFIYALPFQSIDKFKSDLDFALQSGVTHLSFYSLILEERTLLYHRFEKGELQFPSEDEEVVMQEILLQKTREHSFHRYEVSNFAKEGNESLHNLKYWTLSEYVGVGMAAASQIHSKRYHNFRTIRKYLDAIDKNNDGFEEEEAYEPMSETLLMGLRLTKGIQIQEFVNRFQKSLFDCFPFLQKFIDNGILIHNLGRLYFSEYGMAVSNQVFVQLI